MLAAVYTQPKSKKKETIYFQQKQKQKQLVWDGPIPVWQPTSLCQWLTHIRVKNLIQEIFKRRLLRNERRVILILVLFD